MATVSWRWKKEKVEKQPIPSILALTHPLKQQSYVPQVGLKKKEFNVAKVEKKKSGEVLLDPLSQMALEQSSNGHLKISDMKLNRLISSAPVDQKVSKVADFGPLDISSLSGEHPKLNANSTVEPWEIQRELILLNYTTSEKLSLLTSFLPGGTAIPQPTLTEKVANKLEQLDQSDSSDLRQMLNLSQADYISKISDLQKALKAAWDSDQRVMSIRIAIQSAKLLADTSVVQFYPSKFVLITDILDSFGQLVFDRLMAKANSLLPVEKQLDSNTFDSSEVPESAKETCRNWFYKIASIRELLPRLYVESAILKSLKFLDPTEHSKVLKRLCLMARGIGDPLVAAFARCYLCRVASKTDPSNPDYSRLCFDDILSTYSQVVSTSKRLSVEQKISFRKYFDLYSPAVEWILRSNTSLSQNQEELLPLMLEKCRVQRSEILLKAILVSFRPQLVANCATELIQMIKETTELSQTPIADQIQNEKNMSTRATLLKALGGCLTLSPPAGIDPLKILNDVWKLIMRLGSTYDYAVCAAVWMEFASRNFGTHEVDTLLRDVVSHVTPDRAYEQLYPQLKDILEKILMYQRDFAGLLAMEKFAEFLNFFQSDLVKFEASKTVLEGFIRSTEVNGCDDLVVSSECLSLGKCLHDSLDSLSSPEQCDSVANLLIDVLDRFDFGLDFERQLQLYVEARGNFANLDKLVAHLVRRVNLLAIRTLRQCPNGRHSRKSGGFVRGCLAFAFISIPSLGGDIFTRLHLYLEAAQVALVNLCLPQADAMCKSAVSLLLEVPLVVKVGKKPVSNEPRLLTYINDFLSFLLVVPDSPDLPPLYLLKGLINAVRKYPWPESSDGKISIWFAILTWLSTASRPQLPYHIDGLNSNDSLYGGNEAVMTELQTIADSLLDEVLTHLKWLGGNKGEFRRQSIVSLNLVDLLIQEADLSCEEMSHLTINLINLVTKKTGSQADLKSRLSQTRIFLKFKADRGCQQCQYILDRI